MRASALEWPDRPDEWPERVQRHPFPSSIAGFDPAHDPSVVLMIGDIGDGMAVCEPLGVASRTRFLMRRTWWM